MPKKTHRISFRIEHITLLTHRSRLDKIIKKYPVDPSELNRRIIKLIAEENRIWKKLERDLRKDYRNHIQE